jgi:hypothetical protein
MDCSIAGLLFSNDAKQLYVGTDAGIFIIPIVPSDTLEDICISFVAHTVEKHQYDLSVLPADLSHKIKRLM